MILIDTHVVIWLVSDPERLSKGAQQAIDDARENGEGIAISAFTLIELTLLHQKRRIHLAMGLDSFLRDVEERFVVVPISARACACMATLPPSYPKDPADRMIGATALVEGLALVTADSAIRRAKVVRTVW